ncbi:MAG: alpha/beta hydrolase [Planctomycetaceae bacterium]|nr:alpha/beta hydrolase [Planctomycetaceae bacterium]
MDGSQKPPGDRLNLAVLFADGERLLRLEVRAYRVLGDNNEQVVPVEASGAEHRDATGSFRLSCDFHRALGTNTASRPITIPYAALGLPKGTHQIGYEVQGFRDEQRQFATATRLTRFKITDQPRPGMRWEERQRSGIFHVVQGLDAVRVDDRWDIHISDRFIRSALPPLHAGTGVPVPGGYHREELSSQVDAATDETNPPRTRQLPVLLEVERRRIASAPHIPLSTFSPAKDRVIHFATTRTVANAKSTTVTRFGDRNGSALSLGSCVVDVPLEVHQRPEVTEPLWWKRRDPRQSLAVEEVQTLERNQFWQQVQRTLTSDAPRDVLLGIPAFGQSFEFSAVRFAQITQHLQFSGTPLLFSWPFDEESDNVRHLRELLKSLLAQRSAEATKAGRIHVLAHGRGCRMLFTAFQELLESTDVRKPWFGNLVLVTPDIEVKQFLEALPKVLPLADSVTLYLNRDDLCLKVLPPLRPGLAPLGQDTRVIAPPLVCIDANDGNTSLLGSGEFDAHDIFLKDLKLLLCDNRSPAQREPLRQVHSENGDYWRFRLPASP